MCRKRQQKDVKACIEIRNVPRIVRMTAGFGNNRTVFFIIVERVVLLEERKISKEEKV